MKGLAKMRQSRSVTQEELAKAVGVSQETICSWENETRTPNIEKLKQLANALGCSYAELLDGEEETE